MFLLDTNVASTLDPARGGPDQAVARWIRANADQVALSVVSIAEFHAGALILERRGQPTKAAYYARLAEEIAALFADRLLTFDAPAAIAFARLAERARANYIGWQDLMIAAIAESRGLVVVTRNVKDFAPTGVRHLDPFALTPDA